jgi:hypothetical protein
MDQMLCIITFALANFIMFYPLEGRALLLLEILLVLLLGMLMMLKIFQLRRPGARADAPELPVRPQVPEPAPVAPAQPAASPEMAVEAGVVQFLARMQEKGRLVDFLMDDITPFSNEQIGVVARVVHQGCREVVRAAFDIEPVHGGKERDPVVLAGDYDAGAYRLVGKVPEQPPYRGTVLHRGWKATRISLPRVTEAARVSESRRIIAPADVEIV